MTSASIRIGDEGESIQIFGIDFGFKDSPDLLYSSLCQLGFCCTLSEMPNYASVYAEDSVRGLKITAHFNDDTLGRIVLSPLGVLDNVPSWMKTVSENIGPEIHKAGITVDTALDIKTGRPTIYVNLTN